MTIDSKEKGDIINDRINYKQGRLSELRELLIEQNLIENNQLMIEKVSRNISILEQELSALQEALDDLP